MQKLEKFQNFPIKFIFHLLNKKKYQILLLITIVIASGFISSIDSILLKNLIDTASDWKIGSENSLFITVIKWVIGYFLWWESINWMFRLYDYTYLKTLPKLKGMIVSMLYNYTQYHSYDFFQKNLAGKVTNRIMESAKALESLFAISTEKILHKIFTFIVSVITMYYVHPVFALIFFTWLFIFCGLNLLFSKKINYKSMNVAERRNILSGRVVDSILNISTIRIFNNYKHERYYLNRYVDDTVLYEQKMQWFLLKLKYILGLSCSVMIGFMLYYLFLLYGQERITVGDFALILSLCVTISDDLWDLGQDLEDLYVDYGVFCQSLSLLNPYDMEDKPNAKQLNVTSGKIEFKDVIFSYNEEIKLFNNKSIVISGKEKVGLVGFSGGGKTTFVNLILRLYDVDSGEILIDGQNIKDVTQESLHQKLGFIPQETLLFHRTVRENIKYGKLDATEEEVIKAAKKAYVHEDIMRLSNGYDTICGTQGSALSGGQCQRIIIARAILKNAPILILDEATNSLDSITEQAIQDSLHCVMKDKTVLVIAHRLSTLLNMDKILVFEKGKIVEMGTHKDLLLKKGLYYKLWNSQVKGFIVD